MDHRRASLQFLRSTGLFPVKVRPNQKDPFSDWDPRSIKAADIGPTMSRLENDHNLNVGALFSGKYVDIDIDTNDANLMAALDYFLPKTPYVWGRPSKPNSHRAYVLNDDFDRDTFGPILRFMKALKIGDVQYSVEIRGGKPENGMFTVLPGSYRGDVNETVEWSNDIDPSVSATHIDVNLLVKQVRLAQATAIIAAYFTDGVRNDLSLALSGLLWRIRANSMVALGVDLEEEVSDDTFLLREDDAHALYECLLNIADPNKADRRQRVLNFTNTWRKLDLDAGAKVTGGKVFAEIVGGEAGEKLVRSLYRLLSDNTGIEQLERLAEQFVVWYGQGVLIDLEMVRMGRDNPWMNKEQATNSLGARKVEINGKKIPLVNVLFGSSMIQRVGGLTFDPSSTEHLVDTPQGPMVNQWRGFAVQPSTQTVTHEEIRPFLDYVEQVLANGDEKIRDWILDWVADLFQEPHKKPGTTMVFVGPQGAGKSFLGEQVISKIIGEGHSLQINSIETLTNQFNVITDNKIFIQCEEAIHAYQKGVASRLKSVITDETMVVEPKGINSFRKPSHIHLIFTSNEENNPVFIDPSPHERRFMVQKVSARYALDLEYWENIRAWVAMNLHKILKWFLDRPYDKKTIRRPPGTQAKREIQRMAIEPEVSWILNRIHGGFPIDARSHEHWWHAFPKAIGEQDKKLDNLVRDVWPDRIHAETLEADFRSYIRQHGRQVYSGSLLTVIKRVLPDGSLQPAGQVSYMYMDAKTNQRVRGRTRVHDFPSKEAILDDLAAKYGSVIGQLLDDLRVEVPEIEGTEDNDRTDI